MQVVLSLLPFCLWTLPTLASVTIYTQVPLLQGSQTTSSAPLVTNIAHVDNTTVTPPPAPSGVPPNPSFVVQLTTGGMTNLSVPHKGNFMGFSVELSVADQIFGKNGSHIQPVLLNLLSNLRARGGGPMFRVGGNTQERAVFFPDGLPGDATIIKDNNNKRNPTDTPAIDVGVDLLNAFASISSLTDTQWFIGVPFNDTANPRLSIAEYSEKILGSNLLGLQLGNEPDLYGDHGNRDPNYAPGDYVNDFLLMTNAIQSDSALTNKTNLAGPSLCCNWSLQQVLQAGWNQFFGNVSYITVEHYPTNNCKIGGVIEPQDIFSSFLSHQAATSLVGAYTADAQFALSINKPYIMMETNTASCGGFPGVSDSFGAALWAIDYSLQMAFNNFTAGLFHIGGQNTVYNAFTPPPGKAAKKGKQWTVGPIYYAALIVAEALGASGNAQVVDLNMNNGNANTPGYVIYENGNPVRVALFNFVTDPSGASSYTAQLAIDGSGVNKPNASPAQVTVRYFNSSSVADKIPFYYANQTFGEALSSDGTLKGTQNTITINCDSGNNLCSVPVPAPGFALVFLDSQAQKESSGDAQVFSTTTAVPIMKNTATIDPSVLATSNGRGGLMDQLGSTSLHSSNNVLGARDAISGALTLACVMLGAAMVGRGLLR